jgi:hypothetical protein
MTADIYLRPKPEEEELQQKREELEALERQLIDREVQLVSLKQEVAAFESVYVQKVGTRYAELDELEAQIAEILAKRAPSDARAQHVAQQARARAEDSQSTIAENIVTITARFYASSSLRSLYREVAKRIHPDLATGELDRAHRQRLMAEANRAYESGDEVKLRAILEEYEGSPELVFGEGAGAELVRVIRKIAQVKRRLAEIEEETTIVTESELFDLKTRVDEGNQQGRDILNEMAASVNLRIRERQTELTKLREGNKR